MRGVSTSLEAANLGPRRLTDQELFEEVVRAQVPKQLYFRSLLRPEDLFEHRSVRERATVGSILNETESYLNIDGYLHSIVSLRELPDARFPGMLQRFLIGRLSAGDQWTGHDPRPGQDVEGL